MTKHPAAAAIPTPALSPVESPVCGGFGEDGNEEAGLVVILPLVLIDVDDVTPKVAANLTPVLLSQHAVLFAPQQNVVESLGHGETCEFPLTSWREKSVSENAGRE
jgi:hypothetical protein